MEMRLIQFLSEDAIPSVGVVTGEGICRINGFQSTLALAAEARLQGIGLAVLAGEAAVDSPIDYAAIVAEKRLLPPVTHPDPAHCWISGTGLTHLGSAFARHAMHQNTDRGEDEPLTDSMKMFNLGVAGGKPRGGASGAQPEWFFKGDGSIVVPPEGDLMMPHFAFDGGEEPEIAGIYLIAPDGVPLRLGFALGNEFSDHIMERQNYLYLAHSKLRPCSFGPELRIGPLPAYLSGMSRIVRDGHLLWEKPFLSGEGNMSHSIANLEYHHFKYGPFRQPGDIHVHFFGTATLSFSDGIVPMDGDIFEIDMPMFGHPLRNRLVRSAEQTLPPVLVL